MLQLLFLLAAAYLLAVPAALWLARRADLRARALETQVAALERRLAGAQPPAQADWFEASRPEPSLPEAQAAETPADTPIEQPAPIRLDGAPPTDGAVAPPAPAPAVSRASLF